MMDDWSEAVNICEASMSPVTSCDFEIALAYVTVFLCDGLVLSVARHWDVLLGGDLGWSAAREFALTRGLEEMLPAWRHGSLRATTPMVIKPPNNVGFTNTIYNTP